jgi:hypothetical protein
MSWWQKFKEYLSPSRLFGKAKQALTDEKSGKITISSAFDGISKGITSAADWSEKNIPKGIDWAEKNLEKVKKTTEKLPFGLGEELGGAIGSAEKLLGDVSKTATTVQEGLTAARVPLATLEKAKEQGEQAIRMAQSTIGDIRGGNLGQAIKTAQYGIDSAQRAVEIGRMAGAQAGRAQMDVRASDLQRRLTENRPAVQRPSFTNMGARVAL